MAGRAPHRADAGRSIKRKARFRIRGPQMNFAIRGSMQGAASLCASSSPIPQPLENAQVIVAEGEIQSVIIDLIQTWTQ